MARRSQLSGSQREAETNQLLKRLKAVLRDNKINGSITRDTFPFICQQLEYRVSQKQVHEALLCCRSGKGASEDLYKLCQYMLNNLRQVTTSRQTSS